MGPRLAASLLLRLLLAAPRASAKFSVRGSDIYDGSTRIRFKGIGVTCTEYMTKMGIDVAAKGEYPGHWAHRYCFGGPASNGSDVRLNEEPGNLLRYLRPDSKGGAFRTRPTVKKVRLPEPYDEVAPLEAPEARPITRMPLTGSLYLYESNPVLYRDIVDRLVEEFTSQGVAVILDLHWNCPDTTAMGDCTGAQAAPMALRHYGEAPGALAFWDQISKRYKDNDLVLYELFNEPWIMKFDDWYSGGSKYAGMKEMYEVIRKNDPEGLIVIGGKDQYALDAQSGIAFYLQYKRDAGSFPANVLWNVHPYSGLGQGLEHSLGSALRIALALKTVGPVIFTEFGQYCCGGTGDPCSGSKSCSDEKHGAHFVHNIANMAEQYDISWVGWAWRGTGTNNMHRPCMEGMAECSQPDIRDRDNSTGRVMLTDGSRAGADWKSVWAKYVAPASGVITVEDAEARGISAKDVQPRGFLPRPCIVDQFNLGSVCGWAGDTDVTSLSPAEFTKQTVYTSILPGLPGSCEKQGCGAFRCDTWTGPCHKQQSFTAGGIAGNATSVAKPKAQPQANRTAGSRQRKEHTPAQEVASSSGSRSGGSTEERAAGPGVTVMEHTPAQEVASSSRSRSGGSTEERAAGPGVTVMAEPGAAAAEEAPESRGGGQGPTAQGAAARTASPELASAYKQCGGVQWSGATRCEPGCACVSHGAYYSQCVPPTPTNPVCSGDSLVDQVAHVAAGTLGGLVMKKMDVALPARASAASGSWRPPLPPGGPAFILASVAMATVAVPLALARWSLLRREAAAGYMPAPTEVLAADAA